jgi:hypothetical protein
MRVDSWGVALGWFTFAPLVRRSARVLPIADPLKSPLVRGQKPNPSLTLLAPICFLACAPGSDSIPLLAQRALMGGEVFRQKCYGVSRGLKRRDKFPCSRTGIGKS